MLSGGESVVLPMSLSATIRPRIHCSPPDSIRAGQHLMLYPHYHNDPQNLIDPDAWTCARGRRIRGWIGRCHTNHKPELALIALLRTARVLQRQACICA